MARTRSVLVDNTIGRIFRNVSSVSQATAASVIAGAKLTTKSISGGRAVLKVRNNIGGNGIFMIGGGLVTQLIFKLTKAPRGSTVTMRVKKGTSYDTATTVADYTIPEGTKSITQVYTVSITLAPGESLYFDIVEVGSIAPGTGITTTIGFYAG